MNTLTNTSTVEWSLLPKSDKSEKSIKSLLVITKSSKDGLSEFFLFFFLIGIHSMQVWTATIRHGVTRKRTTKGLKHPEISLGRTLS